MREPVHLEIYTYEDGESKVSFIRPFVDRTYKDVSRPSLIRAQRMQLKLYDAMKGQSPDGETK